MRLFKTTPGLIARMEGRKPRARKAPVVHPLENKLQCDVAKVLHEHCRSDWLWFHVPNGGKRDLITGAQLKRAGAKAGVPDMVLISPEGTVRFLELKRVSGVLSETQEEFKAHCVKHDIAYEIARNIDEALLAFSTWRCLRVHL